MQRILAILVILGGIYIFESIFNPDASRNDSGQISTEGNVSAFSLRIGDCYDDPAPDVTVIESVEGIPCTLPHDNEIYAITQISGSVFPGSEEVISLARDFCLGQFEDFVGIEYASSVLDITYVFPTEESWNRINDREIACSVFHMDDEQLSGSMKGAEL